MLLVFMRLAIGDGSEPAGCDGRALQRDLVCQPCRFSYPLPGRCSHALTLVGRCSHALPPPPRPPAPAQVWVVDSNELGFYQAEAYHQFHNGIGE